MEGDGRDVTEEDRELITPLLAQRKEETRWLSWYKEQINKKKTELRIVAVGKFRVFFFSVEDGKKKKEAKLVRDAHLLELQEINSKGTDMVQLVFRPFSIELTDLAVDEAITAIRQSFETNFFAMPAQRRFKLAVDPSSRLKPVEGPNQAALAKSCGGFSGTYSAFCDFYRTPIRVDICWDMDNLLPANHVREFDMKEFEQPLTPADFRCLVEALHFNTHFTGFVAHDYKLDKDAMKLVADMLQVNEKIENLVLSNADGNAAGFELIGQAIAKNKKSAITAVDWSNNSVQDKGVAALGAALGALGHGISSLNLDHGDATKKGTTVLCSSLKSNAQMARTLQTLNLAYNRLDADGSNSLAAFVSAPNALKELNLAYTNVNLEVLFPALMRGSNELVTLNVAGNKMTPNGGAQLKTFLASVSKLKDLNLADTAIPVNIVRDVLKSLIANRYFSAVTLNLSSNRLGVLGANMINGIAEEIACIEKLNLSDNDFGDEGIGILAEGLSKCTSIKDLNIADNFTKGKTKTRNQALDAVIDLISSDCPVEKLILSASSTSFAIGEDMAPFIYALATNDFLTHLDISGHLMGDKGGIALGKALQTNRTLQSLLWDGNGTLLTGFNGFKIGLERNSVLTNMPLPIIDISGALRLQSGDVGKIQTVVNQISEAIARNQSPKSRFSSNEGFSQHITLGGAVEREELQKLKYRIRGQTAQPDNTQQKALKDADENDTYIEELRSIQEEMSQALEDELTSKLGHFTGELVPFLGNIHRQLADRLVNTVKSKYQSVDQDMLVKMRGDLDRYSAVDKDSISRILAVNAAQQISSQVTKSFVNTVDTASDAVFDHLLDKLEDIYCSLSGSTSPRESASSSPTSSDSSLEDRGSPAEEPAPAGGGGPPKKLPPVPPAKGGRKPPPVLPPKGAKPGPALGGSGAGGPKPAPLLSPKGGEVPKVSSGITHMTKDRPLGPAQRRRPQRKPQRRPMMEGNE